MDGVPIDAMLLAALQVLGEILPLDGRGNVALWLPPATDGSYHLSVLIAAETGMVCGLAILLRRDLLSFGSALWRHVRGKPAPELAIFGKILLASLPAAVMVATAPLWFPSLPPLTIAWIGLACAAPLWIADRLGVTVRRLNHLDWKETAFLLLAQIVSLVPGTSRMGLSLTVARFCGYERAEAVRLSLFLGIPTLLVLIPVQVWQRATTTPLTFEGPLLLAGGLSLILTLCAGLGLLAWFRHHTVLPFILWRVGVGVLALLAL